MLQCPHFEVRLSIEIIRTIDAVVAHGETHDFKITQSAPSSIRVQATCPDCGYDNKFYAYNPQHEGAVERFPTWLLERLVLLRKADAMIREACQACGLPPSMP